jgi:magnesium-transporting ATPase (P-type)
MLNLEKPTRRVPFSIAIRMRLILFWKTVLYFFVFYRFYELEEENDDQIHRVEEENFKTSTSTKNNKKKA